MAKTAVSIIREELNRLESQAEKLRAALAVLGGKAMSAVHRATAPSRKAVRKRRKPMSPAAKRKMSRMAKARWAAAKRAGRKRL
jgi:hypothetical protein